MSGLRLSWRHVGGGLTVLLLLVTYWLLLLSQSRTGRRTTHQQQQRRPGPVTQFVYLPPPKTGSLLTRAQLRRFCREHSLSCLGQSHPCPLLQSCVLRRPELRAQLQHVFWAAFTDDRLRLCCPAADQHYNASLFHLYLADANTRAFARGHLPPDALRFTMLRHPVDQFISFFNFVTRKHAHIYAKYMEIVDKRPLLDATVGLFHRYVDSGHTFDMPDDYRHLYDTINNIQARVLGWHGSQLSLNAVLHELQSEYALVCVTEALGDCWLRLRALLHWPDDYFDVDQLRQTSPTRYNVSQTTRARIERIQQTDMRLYEMASALWTDTHSAAATDS